MLELLGNVIAEDSPLDVPADTRRPDEGVVISRGTRVYLRTLTRSDLTCSLDGSTTRFLERMVGSEFLHAFKHDWDKGPGFHDAVMNDPTQIVLMVEANDGWTKPVGVVRLFNIHLLEGTRSSRRSSPTSAQCAAAIGVEAGKPDLLLWRGRPGRPPDRGQGLRVTTC